MFDFVQPILELPLIQPLHVAVPGCVFPLLEGPRDAGVEGWHFHDFVGQTFF